MLMQLSFKILLIIPLDQYRNIECFFHLEIPWSTEKVNILLWLEVLFVFFPPYLELKQLLPRYILQFMHESLRDVLVHGEY